MIRHMSTPLPRRRFRLRTSVAAALTLGSLVLTGCGDPDDDGGDGGGGYVAQESRAAS